MRGARFLASAVALAQSVAVAVGAQTVDDPALTVELVTSGLTLPTTMTFVGPDDILVLEKQGAVRRVANGVLLPTPVLTLPVHTQSERGALGIATDSASPPHVFIFSTEVDAGGAPLGNRIHRYDWNPGSGALTELLLLGAGGVLAMPARRPRALRG